MEALGAARRFAAGCLENHAQGICTVNWPGVVIWMTPPQLHISFAELLRAGTFPMRTVGAPTTHGDIVIGMQGIGVSTPSAAAVALGAAFVVGSRRRHSVMMRRGSQPPSS